MNTQEATTQPIIDHTIHKLMGEIETRDHRIAELRTDLIEAHNIVSRLAEQLKASDEQIDRWIDALDMVQDETGAYCWEEGVQADNDRLTAEVAALRRELNSRVAQHNRVVAPKLRNKGRPGSASPSQRAEVLKLRAAGESLRRIEAITGLGLQSVRTVIDKKDRKDRTTLERMRKIVPNKMAEGRDKSRKTIRDMIPGKLTTLKRDNAELLKTAKGLGEGL